MLMESATLRSAVTLSLKNKLKPEMSRDSCSRKAARASSSILAVTVTYTVTTTAAVTPRMPSSIILVPRVSRGPSLRIVSRGGPGQYTANQWVLFAHRDVEIQSRGLASDHDTSAECPPCIHAIARRCT